MRNSSLVEGSGTENDRASNIVPKLWNICDEHTLVGEHSNRRRRCIVRYAGAVRKENVGMSNDKYCEKQYRRKTKGS